jgi:hypothetical protein
MDAFALDGLEERFDFVCCFGILHRVENSLGLLRVLRGRTVDGGTVLVETYGVGPEDRNGPTIRVSEPGEVYARDEFVDWGFGDAGLQRIARIPGLSRVEPLVDVEVDGHPPIIGRLVAYKLPDRALNSLCTKQQSVVATAAPGSWSCAGPALRQSGPGPIDGLAPRAC